MSDPQVRRPRRIIRAEAPPAPPATQQRLAERFQRALQQGRRQEAAPATRRARAAAASSSTAVAAEAAGQPSRCEPPRDAALPAAVAGVAASWQFASMPPDADAQRERDGAAPALAHEGWDDDLVHAIVTLCVRSDPSFEAWAVVLPMDPRVLPQTELHLSFSRHRMSLRFQTQSAQSVRLLSRHRPSLAAMLQQALPGIREIDIDIT